MSEQTTGTELAEKTVGSIDLPISSTVQVVKSSSEILCELFGAFNATPPTLENIDLPDDDVKKTREKKHKKQNKKKSKKVKKEKKSSRSKSRNSSEHKKKSKKSISKDLVINSKKTCKKKKKLGKYSATDSDVDEERNKVNKKSSRSDTTFDYKQPEIEVKQEKEYLSTIPDLIQENVLKQAVSKIVDKVIHNTKIKHEVNHEVHIVKSIIDSKHAYLESSQVLVKTKQNNLQTNQKNTNKDTCGTNNGHIEGEKTAFPEKCLKQDFKTNWPKCLESDKQTPPAGKIKIQNLKFSQVYEATVKQIEEEAKRKAEKYEEGEISDSSSEQRSPTLSLPSFTGSLEEITRERSIERKRRHRHKHKRKCYHHRSRSRSKEREDFHSLRTRRSLSRENKTDGRDRRSKSRSRERSRDRTRKSKHSKGRSRSQSQEIRKDLLKGRILRKSRERSRDRKKDRSRSMERSNIRTKYRRKSKDRSRSRDRKQDDRRNRDRSTSLEKNKARVISNERKRSRERSKSAERSKKIKQDQIELDKPKRNMDEKIDKQKLLEIARKNALSMMKGSVLVEQNKVLSITAGGKTVSELTDFCKLLSKKDAEGHESISSDTDLSSGSESESRPFHHPFQLKDRNAPIVLNIRNSVALPVKSLQEKTAEQARELRLQFPVSSGQHHRKTESQWIPVEPKKTQPLAITAPPPPAPPVRRKRTFTDTPDPPMIEWRESRPEPSVNIPIGQFTGSTGVRVLTQAELASGQQAWARKDQLQVAAPVNSGMGMALLQKMGWRPGEGLGKNKEGALQPLLLEVKTDKKGLVAQEELSVRQVHQVVRRSQRSLEGKHPVSLLNEYCSRRKLSPPCFDLIEEAGPDHKKNFRFKVKVNGVEYTPAVGSCKKKQARAEAAEVCLKELGILPPR